jgi:hypothetical protein
MIKVIVVLDEFKGANGRCGCGDAYAKSNDREIVKPKPAPTPIEKTPLVKDTSERK